MENFGYLSIQVLSAGGAIPLQEALVKIESADEYDRIEPLTALTDKDGKTEVFRLPTPAARYSLAPSPSESPSSIYKVSVWREDYYSRVLDNVYMFENIYTTLTVPLVPKSLYNKPNNNPNIPTQESEEIL